MIGYLVNLLKNELCEDEICTERYTKFFLSTVGPQVISTLSDLFLEIFGESMNESISPVSKNDFKITLAEVFDLISEKIQRGGESFLEISFLCGGIISLTHMDGVYPADQKKMEMILINILTALGLNFCWIELKKTVEDLSSDNIQSRVDSRDQLFSLICGNKANHKKIYDIQNFFEYRNDYQHQAFA